MFELQRDNVVRIVATEHERDKLLSAGFTIREAEQADEQTEKSIDEKTVPELKEYAEKHTIDLQGATKKEDILELIKKAISDAN